MNLKDGVQAEEKEMTAALKDVVKMKIGSFAVPKILVSVVLISSSSLQCNKLTIFSSLIQTLIFSTQIHVRQDILSDNNRFCSAIFGHS